MTMAQEGALVTILQNKRKNTQTLCLFGLIRLYFMQF